MVPRSQARWLELTKAGARGARFQRPFGVGRAGFDDHPGSLEMFLLQTRHLAGHGGLGHAVGSGGRERGGGSGPDAEAGQPVKAAGPKRPHMMNTASMR
ncbi:hypothetical protein GCM10009736_11220 [Actinomadura bangladeshensis]